MKQIWTTVNYTCNRKSLYQNQLLRLIKQNVEMKAKRIQRVCMRYSS